jgi:hypothetical protein
VAAPAGGTPAKAPACTGGKDAYASLGPSASADAGAAWLTVQLAAGGHHLTAVTPGADKPAPDYGTTADAVAALASGGQLTAAQQAYGWLAANSTGWAHGSPAALSQLILAAYATGNDPRTAHGADLVQQLTNLGPAPAKSAASAEPSASPQAKSDSSSSSVSTWVVVGVCAVAGIGIGLLLSTRKRRRN